MTRFIVKTSAAKMPTTCWGRYRHTAVLEVEDDAPPPSMISERSRGVVRIVERYGPSHVGQTARSAHYKDVEAARATAERLNLSHQ